MMHVPIKKTPKHPSGSSAFSLAAGELAASVSTEECVRAAQHTNAAALETRDMKTW